MRIIYSIGIIVYYFAIKIASLFNEKARFWCKGRKNWYKNLSDVLKEGEERVWFHCASLGEFEQGRPLIEKYKLKNPHVKIVLTFFSPSGYEVRKNYQEADYIFYLPIDLQINAKYFVDLVNPKQAFFVKYEYWFNYFNQLNKKNIPIYIVSAIFREDHIFFKFYGGWYRKILKLVTHFFVQDDKSLNLLNKIGFSNVSITGDTRFDRVAQIAANASKDLLVEEFVKDASKVIVLGSSWQPDEELFVRLMDTLQSHNVKLIIAPHEVHKKNITRIETIFDNKVHLYTDGINKFEQPVLVIDCIGILSSLYQYGDFAYIGGAFGAGLHNILEAATFGLPVIFGPNYKKFNEAKELISLKGAFTILDFDSLSEIVTLLLTDENKLNLTSKFSKDYVQGKQGSVEKIMQFLNP